MADRNGYIGRAPGDNSVIIARQTFNPTGVQTDFTFSSGYIPGYLDVYLNGVRLIEANDYTATDTSIVGLTSAAQNGDVVEMVAYKAFNIAVVSEALSDFIVGNDLTVNRNLNVNSDLTVTGDISGRNFTGVAATFTGNVSVGGTLTYEDVTNVDSIGVLTARSGIRVSSGSSIGIGTDDPASVIDIYGDGQDTVQISLRQWNDNSGSSLTDGPDVRFFASGGTIASPSEPDDGDIIGKVNSYVNTGAGYSQFGGAGWLYESNGVDRAASYQVQTVSHGSGLSSKLNITEFGAVELYYDSSKKFETTSVGAKVSGSTGVGTALVVEGDARVTGILTVGTASFTIDGTVEYPTINPTLDFNFAASKTLDRRLTFIRDGVGTYTDELGVIRYASSNVPRFDHDVSTGESLGLLIEEQRTNLIPYSEEFTSWGSTTNVSTASTVAPDGTTNGVEMIENTSNAQHNFEQTISSTGTFVYSIWAKQGSGSRNFGVTSYNATDGEITAVYNLSTGAKVSGTNDTTITAYPDGWYRITLKATTTVATIVYAQILDGSTTTYTGDGSSSIHIWGAQVELGTSASSYIPTAGTTVTRGPDKAFANHIDQEPWFNATEGTLVFENTDVTVGESTPDYPAIGFGQSPTGSSVEAISIFWATTNNFATFLLRTTGESDIQYNFPSGSTAGSKWSFVYKENDIAIARNGSVVHTVSSAVLPSNFFTLILGVNNTTTTDQYLNGHIKRLTYYPKRLPNAQLKGLTAS